MHDMPENSYVEALSVRARQELRRPARGCCSAGITGGREFKSARVQRGHQRSRLVPMVDGLVALRVGNDFGKIESCSQSVDSAVGGRHSADERGFRTFMIGYRNIPAFRQAGYDVGGDGREQRGRLALRTVLEGVGDLTIRTCRVDGCYVSGSEQSARTLLGHDIVGTSPRLAYPSAS
jgi:hypothetical protein